MSTTSTPSFGAAKPSQAELLERIDARLERIEARLAKLDPLLPLLDQVPGVVAMAGDTFDEFAHDLGDLDDRVQAAIRVLERATRPQTLAQLEALFELLESAPAFVAIVGDTFDEFARDAAAKGVALEELVPALGRAVHAMLGLLTNAQVQQLLESDLLLPGAIEALGTTARALATSQRAAIPPMGIFGALSAMREPEVRRAVGFALDVARRFGANIDLQALPKGQ